MKHTDHVVRQSDNQPSEPEFTPADILYVCCGLLCCVLFAYSIIEVMS